MPFSAFGGDFASAIFRLVLLLDLIGSLCIWIEPRPYFGHINISTRFQKCIISKRVTLFIVPHFI